MGKKLKYWLLIILMVVLSVSLLACKDKTPDIDGDDGTPPLNTIVKDVTKVMDKSYSGLIAGNEVLSNALTYSVSADYSLYTRVVNYAITYKANYREPIGSSEIYLKIFDNNEHKNVINLLYDGKDLYLEGIGKNKLVKDFANLAAFDLFWEAMQFVDITKVVYSNDFGQIFDINSAYNISSFLSAKQTSFVEVDENRSSAEFTNVDVTKLVDTVNNLMDRYFEDFVESKKFDLLTQRFFGFNLSTLLSQRFATLKGELINIQFNKAVANNAVVRLAGRLQDKSEYIINAQSSYSLTETQPIKDIELDIKSYGEVKAGQTHLVGEISIPKLGESAFGVDIVTNISSVDNAKNEISVVVEDLLKLYYKNEIAYVDSTGLCENLFFMDINAFNLPKLRFEKINITDFLTTYYNNLIKAFSALISNGGTVTPPDGMDTDTIYKKIMESISSDSNTVYFTVTEDLIKAFRTDDRTTMQVLADALGVTDIKNLEDLLGADFFEKLKIVLSYNFDTKQTAVKYILRDEVLFLMTLRSSDYKPIEFPKDVLNNSTVYEKLTFPEIIKLRIEGVFSVANQQQSTDLSMLFGSMLGDPGGKNTPYTMTMDKRLVVRGEISQNYVNISGSMQSDNQFNLSFYERNSAGVEKLLVSIFTNPNKLSEMWIDFRLPIGKVDGKVYTDGVKFKIAKNTVIEALRGQYEEGGQIFDENTIFDIIKSIINNKGKGVMDSVTDNEGKRWLAINLLYEAATDGNKGSDPIFELFGIKNMSATFNTRVEFEPIIADTEIQGSDYHTPQVGELINRTIGGIYDNGSAWSNELTVSFGTKKIIFAPTYDVDSINIVAGKEKYIPTAKIFGAEVKYVLTITTVEGRYLISELESETVSIDPAFGLSLPNSIKAIFENNLKGMVNCSIKDFSAANITVAGFNLEVFNDEGKITYKVVLGENSIASKEFNVYVGVLRRVIIPADPDKVLDGRIPIVGKIEIDPYEYSMRLRDDRSFDLIKWQISKQRMKLVFESEYGVDKEGLPLKYDAEGKNWFDMEKESAEGGRLTWDFDPQRIVYSGEVTYARASFGSIEIAIEVGVKTKRVKSVKFDNEKDGIYTVDYLVKSTYNLPQYTIENGRKVQVIFEDGTFRTVVTTRPYGITDEEFYSSYLLAVFDWSPITVNSKDLLARSEVTTATFGNEVIDGGVGIQTVKATVSMPARFESSENMSTGLAAIVKVTKNGEVISYEEGPIAFSDAKFNLSGAKYEAYEYNPYDTMAKLPDRIFLNVLKTFNSTDKEYKQYEITWLGVDKQGKSTGILNIDTLRLAHPRTESCYFVVYGEVGDGEDKLIITMRIHNQESSLKSVKYDTLSEGQSEINVDPYVSYVATIPTSLEAKLASGKTLTKTNLNWYVNDGTNAVWKKLKLDKGETDNSGYYDADGNYIFSYMGTGAGSPYVYNLRYVIEAEANVIRQELFLKVNVIARTIEGGTVEIFDRADNGASVGYSNINCYEKESEIFANRISAFINDTNRALLTGVYFTEAIENGILTKYSLYVRWDREAEGVYANSLEKLYSLLTKPSGQVTGMTLRGTIMTNTINEQELVITFNFVDNVVSHISLPNSENCEDSGAVVIAQKDSMGRISVEELQNPLFIEEGKDKVINIEYVKPYALLSPDNNTVNRYATPYQYVKYIFGKLKLDYVNGGHSTGIPQLDFGEYTEETFNSSVLGINQPVGSTTVTYIKLLKFSEGSARETVYIKTVSIVDDRDTRSSTIDAELYKTDDDNQSTVKLYETAFPLPSYIDVFYTYSGTVRYDIEQWKIADRSLSYFIDEGVATTHTNNIPVKLLDNIRPEGGVYPGSYEFRYTLPCDRRTAFTLVVNVPKKNIKEVMYKAESENNMYNVTDGTIHITNPLLFFKNNPTKFPYGFDTTLIPNKIIPNNNNSGNPDFYKTSVNEYYVNWTFNLANAFKPEDITRGIDKLNKRLIASATLPCYGAQATQTINLYLTSDALNFSKMEYEDVDIEQGDGATFNKIVIDPYNNRLPISNTLVLPKSGMRLYFNDNQVSFLINDSNSSMVKYSIIGEDGNVLANDITKINFDYSGPVVPPSYIWRKDKALVLRMTLPGFGGDNETNTSGITVLVYIMSRQIEEAKLTNNITDVNGNYNEVALPNLIYIDPYNDVTYHLPSEVDVKFAGERDFSKLHIEFWKIVVDGTEIDLGNHANFSTATADAYFSPTADSYRGGEFLLKGYIVTGKNATGEYTGTQGFEVKVIVLNRSLITRYQTTHHYDDPVAGLLSDLDSKLNKDMFVNYDKYYAGDIPQEYYYSALGGMPVLPEVAWDRYVDDTVIEYNGFIKDLIGYVYFHNGNIAFLHNLYRAQVEKENDTLIKSIVYNQFFVDGAPYAGYSSATVAGLNLARKRMDAEIKGVTLNKVINYYEVNNQTLTADYIRNTLIPNMFTKYPTINTFDEASALLYEFLQTSDVDTDKTVGALWTTVYKAYITNDNSLDVNNLSEYQRLKGKYYDDLYRENTFTTSEQRYNATLYTKAKTSLRERISAEVFDRMFVKVNAKEKALMQSMLGIGDISAKAKALSRLLSYDMRQYGSYGETADGTISAPSMDFGKIFDTDGEGVLNTIYFNVYNTVSLVDKLDIEFVLNYAGMYDQLIKACTEEALAKYRLNLKADSIDAFKKQLYIQIVNKLTPVDADGNKVPYQTTGSGDKVFDYANISQGNNPYDSREVLELIWTKYYDYILAQSTAHIDNVAPTKKEIFDLYYSQGIVSIQEMMRAQLERAVQAVNANPNLDLYTEAINYVNAELIKMGKVEINQPKLGKEVVWNNVYKASEIVGDTAMLTLMDKVLAQATTQEPTDRYGKAVVLLREKLKKNATAERDEVLKSAEEALSAKAFDSMLSEPSTIMVNDRYLIMDGAYGKVLTTSPIRMGSFATQNTILGIFYSVLTEVEKTSVNSAMVSFRSETEAYESYLFSGNTSTDKAIKDKAKDVWYLFMNLDRAYDKLLANPSVIHYSESDITSLYDAVNIPNATYPKGFLTDAQLVKLIKGRVFRGIMSATESNSNYKKTLEGLSDEATVEAKLLGYNNLLSNMPEKKINIELVRKTNYTDKELAMRNLIKLYERKAQEAVDGVDAEIAKSVQKRIYLMSNMIFDGDNGDLSAVGMFSYANTYINKNVIHCATESAEELVNNRRQAVEFYYNVVATTEEQGKMLALAKALGLTGNDFAYADGLYEALEQRLDFGDIKNNLHKAYYHIRIQNSIEKLKETMFADYKYAYDNNNQDIFANSLYISYKNEITNLYKKVCLEQGKVNNVEVIAFKAFEKYFETRFNERIAEYTAKIAEITEGTESEAKKEEYDKLYSDSATKAHLDKILMELYSDTKYTPTEKQQRMYDAFNLMAQKLTASELKVLMQTADKTMVTMAYTKSFDQLNVDSWKIKQLEEIIFGLKTIYIQVYSDSTQAEKQALDNIFNKEIFDNVNGSNASVKLAGITEFYAQTFTAVYPDIQERLNLLREEYDGYFTDIYNQTVTLMGVNKGLLQGIFADYSVGEMRSHDGFVKALAYQKLALAVASSKNSASNIDKEYLELDEIVSGEIVTYSEQYKEAYCVKLFASLGVEIEIDGQKFNNAKGYLDKLYAKNYVSFDNIKAEQKEEYYEKIMQNLMNTSIADEIKDIGIDKYMENALTKTTALMEEFRVRAEASGDKTDENYQKIFDALVADFNKKITYNTSDNIEDSNLAEDGRHYIYLDKDALLQSGNMVTDKVYISNASKFDIHKADTYFAQEGVSFVLRQLEIKYLDFYNNTSVDDIANYPYNKVMVIDPLNMDLPKQVRGYAVYQKMVAEGTKDVIVDVGMVDVEYDNAFQNIRDIDYTGNGDKGIFNTYQITILINKSAQIGITTRYKVGVDVYFANRQAIDYYTEASGYSNVTERVNDKTYYKLADQELGVNVMVINPINKLTADVANATFVLPDNLLVRYKNYGSDKKYAYVKELVNLTNIVWDKANIKYTLNGIKDSYVRMLSYDIVNEDGSYSRSTYDYAGDTVTTTVFSAGGAQAYSYKVNNAPNYEFFNIRLRVADKRVTKVYNTDSSGNKVLIAEAAGSDISGVGEYWLEAKNKINPYYPEFFYNLTIVFGGENAEEEYQYTENDAVKWEYHASHGANKLQSILTSSVAKGDRYIVSGFKFLSEKINIKFFTSDIEVERPLEPDGVTEGYIKGGTLYILKSKAPDMTAAKQLERFYPYLFYNFARDGEVADWKRIPLKFKGSVSGEIMTDEGGKVYHNVIGKLGEYGNDNISFDIVVVDPLNYATINGEINPFVSYDYISKAINANSRPIETSNEPNMMNEYFVMLSPNRDNDIYFAIDKTKTVYDAVKGEVKFTCNYAMNTLSNKLGSDEKGTKTLRFTITMPFEKYLFSDVDRARLEEKNTPNFTYGGIDAKTGKPFIYWELGKKMTSSMLPTAVYGANNKPIKLYWMLNEVNVNRANGDGYLAIGYYYDNTEQWNKIEMLIKINPNDATENIAHVDTDGNGNTILVGGIALNKKYFGNYFTYKVNNNLLYLREDGTLKQLSDFNYSVMYRLKSDTDAAYSTDFRPLNVGVYLIRIRIEDYNFVGEKIVELTILPQEIIGMPEYNGGIVDRSQIQIKDVVYNESNAMSLTYKYDGLPKEVIIEGGLPLVKVGNWPINKQEKDALYTKWLIGATTEVQAKSIAYSKLYDSVTPNTQRYMLKMKRAIEDEILSGGGTATDTTLNALTFDKLDYNLSICEVATDIKYVNSLGQTLAGAPKDVGLYYVTINIDADQNSGNYVFAEKTKALTVRLTITKQSGEETNYSLTSSKLTYNGKMQNPTINGLHTADGKLPTGVTVKYTYTYYKNSQQVTVEGGIKDIGTYLLNVEIMGGVNFNDGVIENVTVTMQPRELYIDVGKASSQYLSPVNNPSDYITSEGLAPGELLSIFRYIITEMAVKDYFTVGKYPVYLGGFRLNPNDSQYYTEINKEMRVEHNGKVYYPITLKTYMEGNGSIYGYVNEQGEYVYKDIINMFGNYKIYVVDEGEYEVFAEKDAITVTSDEQLQQILALIKDGDILKLYLSALPNNASYSKIILDKNASLSIVGCYDANRNIASKIDRIIVRKGELSVKIMTVNGRRGSSVYIGDLSGPIKFEDCYFDGKNLEESVAIQTSENFANKLFVKNCTITGFVRAMEIVSGDIEVYGCEITKNNSGISISSKGAININKTSFIGMIHTALRIENKSFVLIECDFNTNRVAVQAVSDKYDDIFKSSNTFGKDNGANFEAL